MLYQGDNVEEHLIEHARSLLNQTVGRSCVHLHLSKLNPNNRQSYHLRIALNMLIDSIKSYDGELFLLDNADVVFLCKGATSHQLHEITHKVRYFFSGDPLFAGLEDVPDGDNDPFFSQYDLSVQSRELLGACEQLLSDKLQRQTQNWSANETLPKDMAPLDRPAWPACARGSRDRVPARGVRALRSTRLPAGRAGTFRLPRWAA